MLVELTISNYAVIDRLTVHLGPGFNVLTGETGAGKSIILDALGLLLGDRADAAAVRSGAQQAYVEGIFDPSPELGEALSQGLQAGDAADGLILSREVNANGRSVCRIYGRAQPQRRLAEVGARLVDVHGQSDHLSLLRPGHQLDLLDRYAGLTDLRLRYTGLVRELTRNRRELDDLRRRHADVSARKDLLGFQVNEIAAAGLQEGEDDLLAGERTLRVNALRIHELASLATAALDGDPASEPGAIELIGRAVRELAGLERIDPAMAVMRQAAESAAVQLEELVRDLRSYAESVEFDQQRLTDIEARLDLITFLKRKYGPGIPEILNFERRAVAELAALEGYGQSMARLERASASLRDEAASLAAELSSARRKAARDLAAAVEKELGELGMGGTRLGVGFRLTADDGGLPAHEAHPAWCVVTADDSGSSGEPISGPLRFDATGVDRIELVVSTNPGEPLRPLAAVASGGETSRLMLAVKGVLSEADSVPTLVFDEIDAGIGGRVGEAVGRRLWALGRRHQVIAATHLPQIAAYGDQHLSVRKAVQEGRTTTHVLEVKSDTRVEELSQMLGSDSPATRQKAAELLGETEKVVATFGSR